MPSEPTVLRPNTPGSHDEVSSAEAEIERFADDLTSLKAELRAAADAASSQIGLIAATAATEARLSVETTISSAFVRSMSAALLLLTLVIVECLIGFWAVGAGASITATMLGAAAINLLIAAALHLWHGKLDRKIGFSRTSRLLKGLTGSSAETNL